MVRTKVDGEAADTNGMKAKSLSKLGYSVQIKYLYSSEENSRFKAEKTMMFRKEDMGRGPARKTNILLTEMINDKSGKNFSHSVGAWTTAVGLISGILGFFATILTCICGTWADETPRRVKKSS